MKYDAVVFDLFGTLVDSYLGPAYGAAQAEIATLLGVPLDKLQRVWPQSRRERDTGAFGSVEGDLRQVCLALGVDPDPDRLASAAAVRTEAYARTVRVRPGSIRTLEEIRRMGCKTALVSDCGFEIPAIWPATPFPPYLDAAVFSAEVGVAKPDPRIYHIACDRLGVTADRCLYVGDGGSRELTGAKAVGMHPVLIRVEYERELDQYRPDALEWTGPVITTIEQVLDLVG